jgi:hypothetical protein
MLCTGENKRQCGECVLSAIATLLQRCRRGQTRSRGSRHTHKRFGRWVHEGGGLSYIIPTLLLGVLKS